MPMQMGFRWYGEGNDKIKLSDIKQIPGVTTIVWALHHKMPGEIWAEAEIAELNQKLKDEQDARKADALTVTRKENIREFLSDKKFVNTITEQSIKASMLAELEKNDGRLLDAIFTELTTGADGQPLPNVLITEEEQNRPHFTTPKKPGANGTTFDGMTLSEKMTFANMHPDDPTVRAWLNR